jgi:hypothetical protein
MTSPTSFRVGDIVQFGRTHGEKTRGRVLRISAKSLQIETIEERGNGRGAAVGRKWRVHPSLVQAVTHDSGNPSARTPHPSILRAKVEAAKSLFISKALTFGLEAPVTVSAFNEFRAAFNSEFPSV